MRRDEVLRGGTLVVNRLLARCVVIAVAVTVALCAAEAIQAAQSSQGVSVSYTLPRQISSFAPISLFVSVTNGTAETVHVDLGRNSSGNSQISLTLPSGANVSVDPRKFSKAEEARARAVSVRGDFDLAPGGRRTSEIILNDWVDFSALGVYRIQVEFIGTVRSSKNTAIDVQRLSPAFSVNVVPRNPQELRNIAERLTRQIQSPEAAPALLALRKLEYLDDPIVVSYWIRILDEQKGTRVDPHAIRALEKHGTAEARAAIDRASRNADPFVSTPALDALERLNRQR